jgi:hypothetical protein
MRSSPPRPPRSKAPVLDLVPAVKKPLNDTSREIVSKLNKALVTAKSGAYAGALLFTVDKEGCWQTDIAGQMYDKDILGQIAIRLLGACLAPE